MPLCWFCGADNKFDTDSYQACGVDAKSILFGWEIKRQYEWFPRCADCAKIHKTLRYPGLLGAIAGLTVMIMLGWPLIKIGLDWLVSFDNLICVIIGLALVVAQFRITFHIPVWTGRIFVLAYLKIRRFNIRTPWQADEIVRQKMLRQETN